MASSVALLFFALGAAPGAAVEFPEDFTAQVAPYALSGGAFSDPAWQEGLVGTNFQNVTTRTSAHFTTQAFVLYDATNIYVAFHCDQHGIPVTALQSTNNVGFGIDDFVGIGIDPSGNGSQVYYFETTPAGTRYQQASENARYQPTWQASARITNEGWDAILVVPLSALRLRSSLSQAWRINFVRGIAAKAEHLSWAWNGRMLDAVAAQWPSFSDARYWPNLHVKFVTSSSVAHTQPHAEIFSLVSAGVDRKLFAQADGSFAPQVPRNVGGDLSVPLSSTMNFVGTLRPDFSNIEIDQQTITPLEFSRVLTEYRPFFAQGASFLNPNTSPSAGAFTPNNQIFYSPYIGPFNSGEKVEGTFGHQAFGIMQFSGFSQITHSSFNDIAYGFLHDLADQSFRFWSDGVIAHDSLAGNDSTAEVGASDLNLKTGLNGGIDEAFETGSYMLGPRHADSFNAYGGVTKPNYGFHVRYQNISPNYDPLVGFTTAADLKGWAGDLLFSGAFRGVKAIQLEVAGDRFLDRSGAVHQSDLGVTASATLNDQLTISAGPQIGFLRSYATQAPIAPEGCLASALPRTSFTGFPHYFCPRNQEFSQLAVSLGYREGTPSPVDLSMSEGPFGGFYLHQYTSALTRQLSRHISFAIAYDGTYAVPLQGGAVSSQWLRRLIATEALGADSSVSLEYRTINGSIGTITSPPGSNLSISFHQLLRNGNSLYVNYGAPAANQTLNRLIAKYIFNIGGGAGT